MHTRRIPDKYQHRMFGGVLNRAVVTKPSNRADHTNGDGCGGSAIPLPSDKVCKYQGTCTPADTGGNITKAKCVGRSGARGPSTSWYATLHLTTVRYNTNEGNNTYVTMMMMT